MKRGLEKVKTLADASLYTGVVAVTVTAMLALLAGYGTHARTAWLACLALLLEVALHLCQLLWSMQWPVLAAFTHILVALSWAVVLESLYRPQRLRLALWQWCAGAAMVLPVLKGLALLRVAGLSGWPELLPGFVLLVFLLLHLQNMRRERHTLLLIFYVVYTLSLLLRVMVPALHGVSELGPVVLALALLQQQTRLSRVQLDHVEEEVQGLVKTRAMMAEQLVERLRQQQLRYEALPVILHVEDGDHLITAVSSVWLSTLGYDRSEVLNSSALQYWPEDARRYMMDIGYPRLQISGVLSGVELNMQQRDGSLLSVLVSAVREEEDGQPQVVMVAVDITERKKVQSALVSSEQRFRRVFDVVPNVAVFGINANRQLNYWNAACTRMFGYESAESLGKQLEQLLLTAADRPAYIDLIRRTLASGDAPAPQEWLVRTKGGEGIAVYVTQVPILNRQGDPEIYALALDVSEVNQLRNELALTSQRFAGFAEASMFGVFATDAQGCFEFVNARYCALTGMLPGELLGKTWHVVLEHVHPDDVNILRDNWYSLLSRQREVVSERRFVHPNNRIIWTRVHIIPTIEDGRSIGVVGTMEDVTEQREIEMALRDSQERFSRVFHMLPDVIFIVDLQDDRVVDVNEQWLPTTGYSRDDSVGAVAGQLEIWQEPRQWVALREEMERAGTVSRQDLMLRRADGLTFVGEVTSRIAQAVGQRLMIIMVRDVTELRANERAVRELTTRLEERVRDRTRALESSNRDLAETLNTLQLAQDELVRTEKLAALGAMVAGVAHELNTPIGNSVTVTSTLVELTRTFMQQMEGGSIKKSTLQSYLESSQTAGELLFRNLEQARDLIASFKQVAVDQTSAKRRQFSLLQTLEEVLAMLATSLKKTPYQIQLEVDAGLKLDSFPGPLGQIITNLVNNAILHGFEGRPAGTILIRGQVLRDGWVQLVVQDDGRGIALEQQRHIFDPFYTTKLGQGGSGLGLHIVYSIVNRILGGKIRVESTPGAGATFIMELPMVAPEPETAGAT
ncbi:PAS domain S-box protein [Leeia sp.]|uniref:PAS domain-containing sensor histidine kinase n=1 Tax=Leeia sp. TaxID=2884678 RepID=UPI0035B36058